MLVESQSALNAWRPMAHVLRNAVQELGDSAANALQFLIRAIPWVPIVAGAFFLLTCVALAARAAC